MFIFMVMVMVDVMVMFMFIFMVMVMVEVVVNMENKWKYPPFRLTPAWNAALNVGFVVQ